MFSLKLDMEEKREMLYSSGTQLQTRKSGYAGYTFSIVWKGVRG